jgi:hypothetical protein
MVGVIRRGAIMTSNRYIEVIEHFFDEGVVNGFEFAFLVLDVQLFDGIVAVRIVDVGVP